MSIDAEFGNPSTGFGAGTSTSGGAPVDPGQSIEVKPANDVSPTYDGAADTTGGTVSVTLPATVAMVAAGGTVQLATSSGSSAGNVTANVNVGALTNVQMAAGVAVTSDGATVPLSGYDNTGLLAMVPIHVANDIVENIALPHNYAVVEDQHDGTLVNQYNGDGDVAMIASVTNNNLEFTLANSTSRIIVNAGPVTVKNSTGAKTAGGVFDVDLGALNGVTLEATAALVTNTQASAIPVTGTYTNTVTFAVAGGVITGITLS